jgi:hypothetical protein
MRLGPSLQKQPATFIRVPVVGMVHTSGRGNGKPRCSTEEEELVDAEVVPSTTIGRRRKRSMVDRPGPVPGIRRLSRCAGSMVMQRKSLLNASIALMTAVAQLLIREFNPPAVTLEADV